MQFYSDYSSEEVRDCFAKNQIPYKTGDDCLSYPNQERDDDEIDLWNPNDLIDEIMSVEDEAEQMKMKKALLEKFLDQERPLLTSKMRDFFLEEGVTESLMAFVSRMNEINKGDLETHQVDSVDTTLAQLVPRPLHTPGQEEDVKRSFNVMEIFVNPAHDLYSFLPEKLPVILRELFKVFEHNSSGNFYHFNKILEQLLARTPSATTKALLNEGLLWKMLDFLHETPIIDTLIDTFSIGFPRQSDTIQFYKSLADAKMFDKIGERLYGRVNPGAQNVSEFFIKLTEKLSSIEMSGILFISLCRTSSFIDGLCNVITTQGTYPFSQKQACASVLRELLLKSGQKVFEQMDFQKPIPNMLSAIHDKLHDYAKAHIASLCDVLIEMDKDRSQPELQLQSYVVKRPFGYFRLLMTDIVSDVIVCAPEVLDKLPADIWRVLSSWFLEYRYNNLYHFHFWKVYQLIIRENHVESQKALFKKENKFLTEMIKHYRSTEQSGCRGFIIVMCNTLRFAADLQDSNGYLRQYLSFHDSWRAFLPQLRTDTLLQQKRYEDLVYMNDLDGVEDDDGGIDLGSAYARSLGFDEPAPAITEAPPKPKKKKKKNKNKKKKSKDPLAPSSEDGSDSSDASDATDGSEKDEEESDEEDETDSPQPDTESTASEKREAGKGLEVDATSEEATKNMDWWKSMVTDLEKEDEVKRGETNDDWWQELKSELQTMDQEHKDSVQAAHETK